MFVKPRKSLFQQLQEADDDATDIMNTQVGDTTTNTDPNAGEAESTPDEDLDVNTDLDSLDDPTTDTGNNDIGGDMDQGEDTSGGDTSEFGSSTTTAGGSNPDEEVKKGNTDLFASLTAEEQSIKIMELKRLYNDLYTSTDDLLYKLSSSTIEQVDPRVLSRIQSQMEELRRILQDYIINSFAIKTYYENDVNYSIFLSMFTTIRGVFDEVNKQNEQNSSKK